MPAAETASARARQSSPNTPISRARANSGAASERRQQRGVLEARQQGRRQRGRPAAPQRLDRDPRGLGLASLAGLDLDIAAQPQLAEAIDRLLEGRHLRGELGAPGLGHQPIDRPSSAASEESCITIGTASAVSLTSISTQLAPRRRASRKDARVFSGA